MYLSSIPLSEFKKHHKKHYKLQHIKFKYTITEFKLIDSINSTTKTQNAGMSLENELVKSVKAQKTKPTERKTKLDSCKS